MKVVELSTLNSRLSTFPIHTINVSPRRAPQQDSSPSGKRHAPVHNSSQLLQPGDSHAFSKGQSQPCWLLRFQEPCVSRLARQLPPRPPPAAASRSLGAGSFRERPG